MAFARFLLVGLAGFLVDSGVTLALIALGAGPWAARVPAIAAAMVFTWLANRRFAFRARTARTVSEAARYATVAAAMASFNYLAYLGLLALDLAPVIAIAVATGLQAVLSFHAYRRIVFS
ncbi:MAG: hypothetical protein RJA99_3245 [Pseudomonadota bacterium]|jgi:putative flippase GtrA